MGFRRAIVPAGTDAIPSDCPIEVTRSAELPEAIIDGFGTEPLTCPTVSPGGRRSAEPERDRRAG